MRSHARRIVPWAPGFLAVLVVFSFPGRPGLADPARSTAAKDLRARYHAGLAAFRASRWPDALAGFQAAAAGATGDLKLCAANMIGQVHCLEGRLPEARSAFAEVVAQARALRQALPASHPAARRAAVLERLALHYQAEILEQQHDWKDAITVYEQLVPWASGSTAPGPRGPDSEFLPAERLACLYWRVGDHAKAEDLFEQMIARFPDHPRAFPVRLALISLQEGDTASRGQKLAFLSNPLPYPGGAPVRSSAPPAGVPEPAAPLPPLPDAAQARIDGLLKSIPPDSPRRPPLLMRKGWMLFEANGIEQAASVFLEAARGAARADTASIGPLAHYADLSRAICLMRQQKQQEAFELVRAVLAQGPAGHARTVADSLLNDVVRRLQTTQAGAKCGVRKLD